MKWMMVLVALSCLMLFWDARFTRRNAIASLPTNSLTRLDKHASCPQGCCCLKDTNDRLPGQHMSMVICTAGLGKVGVNRLCSSLFETARKEMLR